MSNSFIGPHLWFVNGINNLQNSSLVAILKLKYNVLNDMSFAHVLRADQGLRYSSLMNIYSEHFCCSLCSFNHKFYHKGMKTAYLGLHCLFLHKAGFRRWRRIPGIYCFPHATDLTYLSCMVLNGYIYQGRKTNHYSC